MNIKKDILWRVYLAFFFVVMLGGMVAFRIVNIQVEDDGYWKRLADSLTTAYVSIEPVRGNIYSDDGSLMATSLPIYDVRLDLNTDALTNEVFNKNIDSLSIALSNYFDDKSPYQYKKLLNQQRNNGARYYLLKRNINHNQLKDIKNFPILRLGRYKGGLIIEQKSRRIKPFGELAKRTIGYKVKNVIGVGLEGAYNEHLSGNSGIRLMQKVSGGQWIPINDQNEKEPEEGKDVFTTININIQDVAENALLRALKKNEAHHGCAIVMEVETGHIKAIANLERNEDESYSENYNFAVGESLEPGSTFKLASALVLLENDLISPDDTIDTENGSHRFFENTDPIRDAKKGGYGKITFREAFEVSSNVAFSKLIFDNFSRNPHNFINELKALNLHLPLGIPIAGEGMPVIKEPGSQAWSGTTLPWMSMGYELRMTPLQLLTLYNAIANRGKMVKPLFATEVREVGKREEIFETEVIKEKICSDETLQILTQLLIGVVNNNGTAENLKTDQYIIAGKTGTAQIATEDGYNKDDRSYLASFAGFFPADNPKYSCIVSVNSPTKGIYYGALVAGPVFREISDKIYAQLIEKEDPISSPQENKTLPKISHAPGNELYTFSKELEIPVTETTGAWVKPVKKDNKIILEAVSDNPNFIPDVRGMTLTDALYVLENRGLKVHIKGSGKVKSQSLAPNTPLGRHNNIEVILN